MEVLKIETFENILVSDLNVCLRGEHLDDVPRQFFVDWISLVLKVTKVKFPSFEIPAIPDAFKFEKSDYASSLSHEDYYNLNYYYCGLTDQNGCGINLTAFDGYQHPVDGTNAISIEPVGIPSNEFKLYSTLISSHINLYTYPPLATFIIGVEGDQKLRIEEIFEEHKKSCLAIQNSKIINPPVESKPPFAEQSYQNCSICSTLANNEWSMQTNGHPERDKSLPEAAESLEVVKDFTPGNSSRALQLKQCPECATYYRYETDYEYLWGGSEDEQKLTRLTLAETAEYLE